MTPEDRSAARTAAEWDAAAAAAGIAVEPGDRMALVAIDTLGPRPFGPYPVASERCESGRRPYCTCSTCF